MKKPTVTSHDSALCEHFDMSRLFCAVVMVATALSGIPDTEMSLWLISTQLAHVHVNLEKIDLSTFVTRQTYNTAYSLVGQAISHRVL